MKTLNIVIPMAGRGSRFTDAGFALPKPLIDVGGTTMIELVIRNLKPSVPHRFIFICLREHLEKYGLRDIFKKATGGNDYEVVALDDSTSGAACTVLCAKKYIDNDDDLLTANSDQYLSLNPDLCIADARKEGTDGLIMTFDASHPKWSYARTDETGRVVETAEKKPISKHATVGLYYFARGADFVQAAEEMIRHDRRQNGEFYICPVYNELIAKGAHIRIHDIDASNMHGLGTPEDLEEFLGKLRIGAVKI